MLTEDDILCAGALRLDGYRAMAESGFDPNPAIAEALRGRRWALGDFESMMTLFMLQRHLFKWGGVQLARDSPQWWLCRTLFLRTCRIPVPEHLQDRRMGREWFADIVHRLDEAVAVVQQAHSATRYDFSSIQPDDSAPDPDGGPTA